MPFKHESSLDFVKSGVYVSVVVRLLLLSALLYGQALISHGQDAISTVRQALALSQAEVERGMPVKVRGVITFHEPATGLTIVQDETGGMAVAAGVPSRIGPDVRTGSLVEVEGVVSSGPFAPVIGGRSGGLPEVKVLGSAPLPDAVDLGLEKLARGTHDGLWIEMRGIVRAVNAEKFTPSGGSVATDRLRIHLGTPAGRFTMVIPWAAGLPSPGHLLDARVRVHGVLGSIANASHQWMGLLLYVPSMDHVHVERAAAVDPFDLPMTEANELLRYQPKENGESRVRLQGQVTMLVPDEYLFMRCEDRSIQVWVSQSLSGARIGSMIDVVGYPLLVDSNVLLQDGIFKVISHDPPPQPLDLTYSEVLDRFVDVELVRMRGRLLQDTIREASRLLILEMDGHLVEASFSGQMGRAGLAGSQPFRPGTELELTGISRVKGTTDWDGSIKALDMSLNLRDLSDVRVVKAAPWWTKGRVLVFLAVLMALATAVSGWAVTLRRRVSAQTLLIREQAEREASERERIRIARNIHDDLGSRLTQLALLGERVKYAVGESGPAAELGVRISGTALSAVATMDEIVWAVNPRNDSLQSLADYLCQLTPSELSDAGIRCELDVPAVLPALSLGAEIRHGLVLAVREILHNIIKHSGASEIRLGLQLEDHGILEISISDNGRGFDPATVSARRNGLLNLRGRMADAGGACEIESSHGSGTRVVLRVPLDGKKDSLRDHTKV